MVNVASQQPAEIVRVLASSTASALMPQEADAVNIRKDARCTLRPVCLRDFPSTQFWGFTLAVASYELRDMTPVNWRSHKSQLFLECVLENLQVPVLTEYERNNQPIIARANLAIATVITEEFALAPAGNIWSGPIVGLRFVVERRRCMTDSDRRQQFSLANRLRGSADQNTVHDDLAAGRNLDRKSTRLNSSHVRISYA